MPRIKTVAEILNPIAPIAQYLAANDAAEKKAFRNADIDEDLAMKIYIEKRCVQWKYDRDPTDSTLRGTANYLYALLNKYSLLALRVVARLELAPPVITNPVSIAREVGQTAFFEVAVTSTIAYTVQWYRNGVPIVGANSLTLSFIVSNADDGALYSAQATSTAGVAASAAATLTVNAQLLGDYYYGDTNYIADIKNHVANIDWVGSFNVVNGQDIVLNLPRDLNNEFLVVRYPDSQTPKLIWQNTPQNNGTIPDQLFEETETFGGYRYAYFRVAGSLESSSSLTLS